MTAPRTQRLKRWGIGIFICVFMAYWIYGMTLGMIAGQCRNDRHDSERHIRSCDTWISLGAPLDALPTEYRKAAAIYLERGIHHARLGNENSAIADFQEARRRARFQTGSQAVPELLRRLAQEGDPSVEATWLTSFETQ